MTTFTQALLALCPTSNEEEAAAFRSGLLAINMQMQEMLESPERSLHDWWQWLDDEGYERDGFVAVLNKVCSAKIGEQALAELTSHCQSMQSEPQGLPALLDWVHERHPDLPDMIGRLEQQAAAEEEELLSTAGGMSKGGRDALFGVAALAGGALLGVGGYKAGAAMHRWWKPRRDRVEQAATSEAKSELHRAEDHLKEGAAELVHNDGRQSVRRASTAAREGEARGETLANEARSAEQLTQAKLEKYLGVHKLIVKSSVETELKKLGIATEGDDAKVAENCLKTFAPNEKHVAFEFTHKKINYMDPGRELQLHEKYFHRALLAEVRKNHRELGRPIEKELQPELDGALSDADIDQLFDVDKMIVHWTLDSKDAKAVLDDSRTGRFGETPVEFAMKSWGGSTDVRKGYANFANSVEGRYPGTKSGLREFIREQGIAGLESVDREKILKNLANPPGEISEEYNAFRQFFRKDVCEKMIKVAAKDAEIQALQAVREAEALDEMKQDLAQYQKAVLASKQFDAIARRERAAAVKEAESFVIKNRDFKGTMEKMVAQNESKLASSAEAELSGSVQVFETKEKTAVTNELDGLVAKQQEVISNKVEDLTTMAEHEAKVMGRAAEEAAKTEEDVLIQAGEDVERNLI